MESILSDCDSCVWRDMTDLKAIYKYETGAFGFVPLCQLDLDPNYCRRNIMKAPEIIEEDEEDYLEEPYDINDILGITSKKDVNEEKRQKERYNSDIADIKEWEDWLYSNHLENANGDKNSPYYIDWSQDKIHHEKRNEKIRQVIKNDPTRITSLVVDDIRNLYHESECIYFILQCINLVDEDYLCYYMAGAENKHDLIIQILEHYKLKENLYRQFFDDPVPYFEELNLEYYRAYILKIYNFEKYIQSLDVENINNLMIKNIPYSKGVEGLAKYICVDFNWVSQQIRGCNNHRYLSFKVTHADPSFIDNFIQDIQNGITYEEFINRSNQLTLVNKNQQQKQPIQENIQETIIEEKTGLFKRLFRGKR